MALEVLIGIRTGFRAKHYATRMKDDLLEKISKLLKQPIKNECGIVYFMVETRKLIEHKRKELDGENRFRHYPEISFYSNWCVHIELDRDTAKNYLKKIENLTKKGEIKGEIFNFLRFEKLKEELSEFFKEYNLESSVFFANWESFKRLLVDVLADCPLLIKEPKSGQIRSFYFDKNVKEGKTVSSNIEFEKEADGSCYSASVGII